MEDARPRASLRRRPVSRIEFILAPVEEDLEAGLGLVGGGCEALGWGFEGSDGAISACMVSICMTGGSSVGVSGPEARGPCYGIGGGLWRYWWVINDEIWRFMDAKRGDKSVRE